MSNIIDISSKITNQLPMIKITEDIVATVNNRKSTILNIRLLASEQEKKAKERAEKNNTEDINDEYDELAFMDKVLDMLIAPKTLKSINELDLPFPEYKLLYNAIMNAATGQKEEDSPSA